MERKYFTLNIEGLTRELPICKVNDDISIAAFNMFSDVEMTIAAAKGLLRDAPEFDCIITAESKGIPLAYEMSKLSGKKYLLARKVSKLYMQEPIAIKVKSITTAKEQTLYMDGEELEYMNGKKVLIIDDVVSTGGSLDGLEQICQKAGAIIAGKGFVLAEGDAEHRDDIFFLGVIPLIFNK